MTLPTSAPPSTGCTARCAGLDLKDIFVPPVVIPIVVMLIVLVSALIRYA
jgi:hypothetical protein